MRTRGGTSGPPDGPPPGSRADALLYMMCGLCRAAASRGSADGSAGGGARGPSPAVRASPYAAHLRAVEASESLALARASELALLLFFPKGGSALIFGAPKDVREVYHPPPKLPTHTVTYPHMHHRASLLACLPQSLLACLPPSSAQNSPATLPMALGAEWRR